MKLVPKSHPATIETNEKVGDGYVRYAYAVCVKCGAEDRIKVNKGYTLLAPAAVEKKFGQMGWHIGRDYDDVICPQCRGIKVKKKSDEEAMANVEPIVKPDPPRTMTREDRRIVFEKLNGVYLDEKRGYESGWSDQKVATDLGVPRAWVEQVREEMFGPIASNPEMEAFVRAVADLQDFKTQLASVATLRGQLSNIETVLKNTNVSALQDRVAKLEKLAGEVKKHCVGM